MICYLRDLQNMMLRQSFGGIRPRGVGGHGKKRYYHEVYLNAGISPSEDGEEYRVAPFATQDRSNL